MDTSACDPLAQPHVRRAWYVACASEELGGAPLKRALFGEPLVLFRGAGGRPGALLDRCPHRSVPLSFGAVAGDRLRCGYHGWAFDPGGRCQEVPGLVGEADRDGRACRSFPAVERQGFVWIWGDPESAPEGAPFHFPYVDDPDYLTVRQRLETSGSIHAVAENALDVPHTAFLHSGLFRQDGDRSPIRCVVQRWSDRVEAEYIGEARPEGVVGRILSPSGGVVTHFDRFRLPSVVEVEYRIGQENHIHLNGALTPVSDYQTRLYAVVSVRTRVPTWLVRPVVQPLALRIFGQDRVVLGLQTETLSRFGEARFVSTEIDLLGPHIMRLLRRAERGDETPDAEPYRREVTMLV